MKSSRGFKDVVLTLALGLGLLSSGALTRGDTAELRLESEKQEFRLISEQIQDWKAPTKRPNLWSFTTRERLAKEALRPEALILDTDQTPVDVLLRRTRALLEDLSKRAPSHAPWAAMAAELAGLQQKNRPELSPQQQESLFYELCGVRRKIAFANPLLNFSDLVFLTHDRTVRGDKHCVDQYLGFNAATGGSVYRLKNAFGEKPEVQDLVGDSPVRGGQMASMVGKALSGGSFLSLELDYDAQTLAFAWTQGEYKLPPNPSYETQPYADKDLFKHGHYFWRDESCYHLFTLSLKSGALTQLTSGGYNEFDPCFLPGGRIAFISERGANNQRCGMRWCGGGTLHSINRDGSDLIQLSYHETAEWQPSVGNDGMLLYTRWDYIDRNSNNAHHLWRCFPDGRDPRAPHGNYAYNFTDRPHMELGFRAIPGSTRLVATAVGHHRENYGSLIQIDPNVPDDRRMSQVKRVTPEVAFPESEHVDAKRNAGCFSSPWPLSEDYFLAAYDPNQKPTALYLVDSFGNRIFVYRDPKVGCLDPIPLTVRAAPPVLPTQTHQAKEDQIAGEKPQSTVAVLNVYQSELPWPKEQTKEQKVKALRVIQIFSKDNAYMNLPHMGPLQATARGVLGTAPVEDDGSAYFQLPPGVQVYFQALDEKGLAIQTMRSGTYTHPGEALTCIGCHESKQTAPPAMVAGGPKALRRAPSKLEPELADASYPITFPRLVQPVLDKNCISCHTPGKTAPDLTATRVARTPGVALTSHQRLEEARGLHLDHYGWSAAYLSLQPFTWFLAGGVMNQQPESPIPQPGLIGGPGGYAPTIPSRAEPHFSTPGQIGARVSKLLPLLEKGHHDVKLTAEELHRLTLWMDCNSMFYGAYAKAEEQGRGERVLPRGALVEYLPENAPERSKTPLSALPTR